MAKFTKKTCFMVIVFTCFSVKLLTYSGVSHPQKFRPKWNNNNESYTLNKDDNKRFIQRKYVMLKYDDPEKYQGPIVQEWPPSKNRSVPLYIKENHSFNIIPTRKKLSGKSLIVIVQSRPDAFEARQANRDTWIKRANNQTSVIFLIGSYSTFSLDVQQKINKECREHSDLVVAQDLIEHYSNLTLKTLYTLKFFLEKDHFFETIPKYLMKADDDVFINLPKLYHLLTEDETCRRLEYLLMGNVNQNPKKVLKAGAKPFDLQDTGKWDVPTYMYNGITYPLYCEGSGYVLSRPAAECIYQESLKIPYFYIEDVFITGFAAEACGIQRRLNDGFHTGRKWKENHWKNFNPHKDIMVHRLNTMEKIVISNKFKDSRIY